MTASSAPAESEPAYQRWLTARRRLIRTRGRMVPSTPRSVFADGWRAAKASLPRPLATAGRGVPVYGVRAVAALPEAVREDVRRRHAAHVARLVAEGAAVLAPVRRPEEPR